MKQRSQQNDQSLIIIDTSKMAASRMAAWSLRLLRFRPKQMQTNKGITICLLLLVLINPRWRHPKMADWCLKWLYPSYYSTQKGDVLGVMVQLM